MSAIGENLSHYKILSVIGAGGMGEVFLAEDTQLDRRVALKILPKEFASDKVRLRRFVQEAKAAAALNHPHIAHVYEIGNSGDTHFIAMEFVDGQTLRTGPDREQSKLVRTLTVLTQVADGLAKAHGAGIVHRDLKPDNIMISRDGYAKILDFGLAKLIEPTGFQHFKGDGPDEADASTLAGQTQPGVILGTVGYMSPEQALGRSDLIDNRSDIFSFGCILFEAVTGHRPFDGDSVVKSLQNTIYEPAPPVSDFNAGAPFDLQRIVRRCLAKDPEERYQSIKEVAIELREVTRNINSANGADITYPANAGDMVIQRQQPRSSIREAINTRFAGPRRRLYTSLIGVFIVLAGLSSYLIYGYLSKRASIYQSAEKIQITKLTTDGKTISTAISPDGKYMARAMMDGPLQTVLVKQTNASTEIPVVPAGAFAIWGITFSKDGGDLFYVLRTAGNPGALYKVPSLGGVPQKLTEHVDSPVTFSPDGTALAFVRAEFPNTGESALIIENSDGTGERVLASRKLPQRFAPLYFIGPSWSPDGKSIATSVGVFEPGTNYRIIAVNVGDGSEADLTKHSWSYVGRVEWLADGKRMIMIARDQAASTLQIWSLSLADGEARRVTNDLNDYRGLSMTADFTRVATAQLNVLAGSWVASMADIDQARQIVTPNIGGPTSLSWTPDGKLVYSASRDVWKMDADGSGRKQLTSNAGINLVPAVSPTDGRIVFHSNRTGTSNIWIMESEGNNPRQLTYDRDDRDPTFSADGKWVIYASYDPQRLGLWKVSVDGGPPIRVTEGVLHRPSVSPDGTLIAALYVEHPTAIDQDPYQLAIIGIDGGPPLKTFDIERSVTIPSAVKWSSDGKDLIYDRSKDNVANLWRQSIDGGEPKQVSNFRDDLIYDFALSGDGSRIALSRGNFTRDAVMLSSERW